MYFYLIKLSRSKLRLCTHIPPCRMIQNNNQSFIPDRQWILKQNYKIKKYLLNLNLTVNKEFLYNSYEEAKTAYLKEMEGINNQINRKLNYLEKMKISRDFFSKNVYERI